METRKSIPVQNIIGRITHGLIGLDIFLTERTANDYLSDFLTLEEDEVRTALLSLGPKSRLVPMTTGKLSDEESDLIDCIKKTQGLVARIDRTESEEVKAGMSELGAKLDILYNVIQQKRF